MSVFEPASGDELDHPTSLMIERKPTWSDSESKALATKLVAIEAACAEFRKRGIPIDMPWLADLDDREMECFEALVAALNAYEKAMKNG